ncbi:MAG: hypothetical protein FJX64_02355 [Alphaproteobacteria bacterium]|nr:hypothetical protein [Alphaproteobacteria bacterium]
MQQDAVIEWAPFRTKPGVTAEAVIAAADEVQKDFLAHQPGFVSRELLRGGDGEWTDLVVWESRAAVDAAMQKVADDPVCGRYFSLMDMGEHRTAAYSCLGG